RRRLFLDQIPELPAELLHRHVGGGGEARQLVRIVEVVAPQPDHIAARDGVAGRRDVHPPRARPASRGIDHRGEGDGDEAPRLQRNHRRVATPSASTATPSSRPYDSRLMTAPTSVSTTALSRMRGPGNSSGMSVSVAPAALPIPIARCPAPRPIVMTKYQRDVVLASTIRFFTISTP